MLFVAELSLWLAFGAFEDCVADFHAVSNRQDTGFLALAPVFDQQGTVRCECLLYTTIVEEFSRVFDWSAARVPFFVLKPEDA